MNVKEKIKKLAAELRGENSVAKRSTEGVGTPKEGIYERVYGSDAGDRIAERIRKRMTERALLRKRAIERLRAMKAIERLRAMNKDTESSDSAKRSADIRMRLRERIARLRRKIAQIKGASIADAPVRSEVPRFKDFAINRRSSIARKEALESLKKRQMEKALPPLRGEDIRSAMRVAWLKTITAAENDIKADLYDLMVGTGIRSKVAVEIIEKAFKGGGVKLLDKFMKNAEDLIELPEEALKEEEKKLELSLEVNLEKGTVEGEVTNVEVEEEDEAEERDEEMENRLVSSSVKIPKIGSGSGGEDDLLRKALPQYGVLK